MKKETKEGEKKLAFLQEPDKKNWVKKGEEEEVKTFFSELQKNYVSPIQATGQELNLKLPFLLS